MTTYDVAVLGNGVLGCSTALELVRARPELRVVVIGPGARLGAASTAAGAMLGCFGEITHRLLSSPAGVTKLEIAMNAQTEWPSWVDKLNADLPADRHLAIKDGTYVILNSKGGRLDSYNFQAIIEALEQYDQPFDRTQFGEVQELNASIDARPLAALYLPNEGSIDARAVLKAIVSVASQLGVDFVDDLVVGWRCTSDNARSVTLSSGAEVSAGRFVVAAGAQSAALMHGLSDDDSSPIVPMLAGKGIALTCERNGSAIDHVVRTPNRAGGCGLHLVPGAGDSVYLGATNDLSTRVDGSPTVGMSHFLLGCAIEQLDSRLFQSKIKQWHVGNRPASLDGSPLIGRVWQDNVWVLSGTYRDGFHCSPVLARHTADTVLGRGGTLGDHPFSPLRAPIHGMSREAAIDEIVLHCVSQFYEFSARPPTYMRVAEGIERQARNRSNDTYDQLETDIGLAPEVLELLNWGPDRAANISHFREYLKRAA
jgi:glycine oxidase